jgi:hypothetical protein
MQALFIQKPLHSQLVTFKAKPNNCAGTFCGYMAYMPELFPSGGIADVHFNNWRFNGGNGIAQSHRCMGITARVYHNSITCKTNFVQIVNQFALNIALKILKGYCWIFLLQRKQETIKRLVAINAWFPLAQQVKIRTVDNGDVHKAMFGSLPHLRLKLLASKRWCKTATK